MLDFKARSYLRQHDNQFGEGDFVVALRVDWESRQEYVRLIYYGRMREPYWEVSFNRNAQISAHKRAIADEGGLPN